MSTSTTTKLYGQFQPPERLTLLLEALARGDEAEAERLSGSCPRGTYTMRDAAFGDRLDVAFDIMSIACIDLRCLWGKLDVLRWATAVSRQMATHHQIVSTMAFLDGWFFGMGKPQMEFFSGKAEEVEDEDDVGDENTGDAPEDDANDRPVQLSDVVQGERGRRMAAVEARAQAMTDGAFAELLAAADAVAAQLAEVWTAFDRFSRDRLGVPAATLLDAWEFPTGGEVTAMLASYTHVKPDPAKVEDYSSIYTAAWDRRFAEE